jgi:hypothetical protein
MLGLLEGSYRNKTNGDSLMNTVNLVKPTAIGLFGVSYRKKTTVIASGITEKLTQPTVIRFLEGCNRNETHFDIPPEYCKAYTIHADRPFRGFVSE